MADFISVRQTSVAISGIALAVESSHKLCNFLVKRSCPVSKAIVDDAIREIASEEGRKSVSLPVNAEVRVQDTLSQLDPELSEWIERQVF